MVYLMYLTYCSLQYNDIWDNFITQGKETLIKKIYLLDTGRFRWCKATKISSNSSNTDTTTISKTWTLLWFDFILLDIFCDEETFIYMEIQLKFWIHDSSRHKAKASRQYVTFWLVVDYVYGQQLV